MDVPHKHRLSFCSRNIESLAIKNKVVDKDFVGSVQELVSCDTFDSGCNGGSPLFGFDYFEKNPLETEKDYPYTSGRRD